MVTSNYVNCCVMEEVLRFIRIVIRSIVSTIQLICHGLLYLIYGGPGRKIPSIRNEILFHSAVDLAHKIRNQELSSFEVVNAFIERIEETNKFLNAVVDSRFEAALDDAKKADEFVRDSGKTVEEIAEQYPFLGVPFTCKDAVAIKGLKQTSGLYLRKDFVAEDDADIVKLLRQAGAIPMANTNVPELCFWWETNNSIYGRTYNPYNTNRTSGGSTGGDAANIAVGGSPMGFGSDLGGSIRIPAHFNGIFGHKPSSGVVPLGGHEPLPRDEVAKETAVLGPLSRYASDLLPTMKVITSPTGRKLLNLDEKVDISKLKIFYAEHDGGLLTSPVQPEIKEAVRAAVSFLEKTYGVQVEKISLPALRYSYLLWGGKMMQPGNSQITEELANRQGRVNLLVEWLKALVGMSRHSFILLLAGLLELLPSGLATTVQKHLIGKCDKLHSRFQNLLGTNGVFIYPTMPTAALYHNEAFLNILNFTYTGIFNVLLMPATHCPLGLNKEGLPIGVQLIAGRYQDRLTLALAEELEKAFGGWVPPGGPR